MSSIPSASPSIRVGIGGWLYEPWRGTFYPDDLPQSRELEYASRQLDLIEINSTYYRAQTAATFAKWRDVVALSTSHAALIARELGAFVFSKVRVRVRSVWIEPLGRFDLVGHTVYSDWKALPLGFPWGFRHRVSRD